jgi:hypothetical protein
MVMIVRTMVVLMLMAARGILMRMGMFMFMLVNMFVFMAVFVPVMFVDVFMGMRMRVRVKVFVVFAFFCHGVLPFDSIKCFNWPCSCSLLCFIKHFVYLFHPFRCFGIFRAVITLHKGFDVNDRAAVNGFEALNFQYVLIPFQ